MPLWVRFLPYQLDRQSRLTLSGMFFKIMLNVFYSSIIIENEELVPGDGNPCIICANHSNSVMDAVVLVTSVSRKASRTHLLSINVETETIEDYCEGYNC